MRQETVIRVSAGVMGLGGFAIALAAGLAAGNGVERILLRSIIAMLLCNAAGALIGAFAARVIADHLQKHREQANNAVEKEIRELRAASASHEDAAAPAA